MHRHIHIYIYIEIYNMLVRMCIYVKFMNIHNAHTHTYLDVSK